MKPLTRAIATVSKERRDDIINGLVKYYKADRTEAAKHVDESIKAEHWTNNKYEVTVRRHTGLVHLSVSIKDGEVKRDWRDFQAIKNQLVGKECEGVELYPAESRKVDTANQFHLFVFTDPEFRIPIGFADKLVGDVVIGTSEQRPFERKTHGGNKNKS